MPVQWAGIFQLQIRSLGTNTEISNRESPFNHEKSHIFIISLTPGEFKPSSPDNFGIIRRNEADDSIPGDLVNKILKLERILVTGVGKVKPKIEAAAVLRDAYGHGVDGHGPFS